LKHITVSRSSLVWWSRGKNWDKEIILLPQAISTKDWNAIFNNVFGNQKLSSEAFSKSFHLISNDKIVYCISTCFASSIENDWTGRPISHYMILFFPNVEEAEFKQLLRGFPLNWGSQIESRYLLSFYKGNIFNLSDEDIQYRRSAKIPLAQEIRESLQSILPENFALNSIDDSNYINFGYDEVKASFACNNSTVDSLPNKVSLHYQTKQFSLYVIVMRFQVVALSLLAILVLVMVIMSFSDVFKKTYCLIRNYCFETNVGNLLL